MIVMCKLIYSLKLPNGLITYVQFSLLSFPTSSTNYLAIVPRQHSHFRPLLATLGCYPATENHARGSCFASGCCTCLNITPIPSAIGCVTASGYKTFGHSPSYLAIIEPHVLELGQLRCVGLFRIAHSHCTPHTSPTLTLSPSPLTLLPHPLPITPRAHTWRRQSSQPCPQPCP